jgi:hypothetical protein
MSQRSKPPIEAPELIDDRAIASADQDRLRHAGFSEELAELVRNVPAPANVALFGSWGAGKSGLGRLLRKQLDGKDGIRCVVYDAFKYADFPLRRDFIAQVASSLDIDTPEFHERLYTETTSSQIKLPLGGMAKLLGLFALAALAGMGLFLGLSALTAALLPGSFHSNFKPVLQSGPVLLVTPAALLAAFVALANKWIPIEHKRSKPSSEEEFESTFRKLIEKSKANKLVIFIDELDRCSPAEVVSTLGSVRTFLDVKSCVCVVAADQVVLERALSESLKQATPIHRANPYYSAGSEYLDKVFQYQLSVPPLMPRRLSGFALRLLDGRGGIWEEIDHDRVVSALIPVHVRSPRRVKTLLNAFVITYRIARRRHEEGALHAPPRERADEIAKLVCLRHEFPLFAAELRIDAQMPQYVLEIAGVLRNEDSATEWLEERPGQVRAEVWERAGAYAQGMIDVDVLLPGGNSESDHEELLHARHRHGSQLLAYLQGTARIPGPGRDLVHLETGGEAFDLSPAFADDLEDQAVAGDFDEVLQRIGALEDRQQRQSALRMLARRATEAETSRERENVLSAMTAAAVRIADAPTEDDQRQGGADAEE